jgi:hypothetical protein
MATNSIEFTVTCWYTFPIIWPPVAEFELMHSEDKEANLYFTIEFDMFGRISVDARKGSLRLEKTFQPITFSNQIIEKPEGVTLTRPKVYIAVACESGDARLYIVGKEKAMLEATSGFIGRELNIDEIAFYEEVPERLYPTLDPKAAGSNREETRFLSAVQELDSLVFDNVGETNLLRASLLLRQLLWDGANSLATRLLRKFKVKLLFPYVSGYINEQPVVESLKFADFSKAAIGTQKSLTLTVKDLVLSYAHVKGGVHLGKPNDEAQEAIEHADDSYRITGSIATGGSMRVIARSILMGLRPLVEAVVKQDIK